jgi:hypothetical protein
LELRTDTPNVDRGSIKCKIPIFVSFVPSWFSCSTLF